MAVNWYVGAEDQDVGAFTGALNWALSNFDSLITLLEPSDLDDLIQAMNNEIISRVQTDSELAEGLNLTNKRVDNLLYDPVPQDDTRDGKRIYLNEFIEVFSTDQVDGLNQKFAFFTNALAGKISDLIASVGTGITIDKSNPAFPVITQNRPLWANIQNKPSIPTNIESRDNKGQANGYPSLDSNAQIPIAQLPFLASALIIVPNIAQRDLIVPTGNLTVFVRDATGDPTVLVGWATYLYDFDNSVWIKKSEGESLDLNIVQSWSNITGKPTEFLPSAHNQDISTINGLDAILLLKRNLTDIIQIYEIEDALGVTLDLLLDAKLNISSSIPAAQIIESATKTFIRADERIRWDNTLLDLGTVSTNQTLALNLNNSFKITLGGNIALTLNTARAGQVTKIKFVQDATGNRTVTLPGNCIVATGESIDLGANRKSLLIMDYDGTEFLCSWKKGF